MKGIEMPEKAEKRDVKRGLGFGGKSRLSIEDTDLASATIE